MVSPSLKHPLFDGDGPTDNTPLPQSKRRRTMMNSNPQNDTPTALNSSFQSSSAAPETPYLGSSSQGSSFNSNLGQRPGTAGSATSSISRRPLPVRSFAPKPLQSPYAARAAARRNPQLESSLRYIASLRGESTSNGITGPRPTTSRSVASSMSPQPRPLLKPEPEGQVGSPMFPAGRVAHDTRLGVNRAAAPARVAVTPAPPRRIDNVNFRSERKVSSGRMYHFAGNHPDARSYNALVFNPFVSRHQAPGRAPSVAPSSVATTPRDESRITSFTTRAAAASSNIVAKADGINNFLASAVEKARKALLGNREDKNEERKANEKEAIRKRIEEEQRVKRDEIFREEMEREKMDRDMFQRIREAELYNVHSGEKEVDREWEYGGVNGDPSFVTEDTIPDTTDYTLNGFHAATMVTESVHASSVVMSSFPDTKTQARPEQSPILASVTAHAPVVVAVPNTREESSGEESYGMGIVEQSKQHIISIDSDNETEEAKSPNPHPKFDFTHHRQFPGSEDNKEDDEIDGEAEEGEFDELAEYDEEYGEEYDEEETGEFEDDEEDGEEDVSTPTMKPGNFTDEDEVEEIIEESGEEPAVNSSDSEGGQDEVNEQLVQPGEGEDYIEEETEKDESDTEGVLWDSKAKPAEDIDRSLDSTVIIGGLSQQDSFTPTGEAAPRFSTLPAQGQLNVGPEIIVSSPGQTREPTPISLDQEEHTAETKGQGQESAPRSPAPVAAEPGVAASSPTGLIIIDDDTTDVEPGEALDVLVAETEEYDEDDYYPEAEEETPVKGKSIGITRNGDDVYNRFGKHIGSCDEEGYVWADIDEMVIGFISAKGEFHKLAENLEDETRAISEDELFGKPREDDVDVEVIEDEGEPVVLPNKEIHRIVMRNVGDSAEKMEDFGDARRSLDLMDVTEVGAEEDGSAAKIEDEKVQDAEEDSRVGKPAETIAAFNITNAEPEDESMYEVAPLQLPDPAALWAKEQPETGYEPMIEEEEQVGIDFYDEHENKPEEALGEIVFTLAKESREPSVPFFHFHNQPQRAIGIPSPYRPMSNDELSEDLKLEAGRLVVKELLEPEVEEKDEVMREEDDVMEEDKGNVGIEKGNEAMVYPETGQNGQKGNGGEEPFKYFFHSHPQPQATPEGLHKYEADTALDKNPNVDDQVPIDPELSVAVEEKDYTLEGMGVERGSIACPKLAQVKEQIAVDPVLPTASKDPTATPGLSDDESHKRAEPPIESVDEGQVEFIVEVGELMTGPERTVKPLVLMEESEVEPELEPEQEVGSDNEADESMLTAIEEPDMPALIYESVVIIERDDASDIDEQEEDETSHSLRPDSVDDRGSMIRELFREDTVEEQVIEWQNSERRESYSRISVTVEEESEESASESGSDDEDNDEMEEEGTVDEEVPVDEERAIKEARVEQMAEKAVEQQLMGEEIGEETGNMEDEVESVTSGEDEGEEDELAELEQSAEIVPEVGAEADVEDAADSDPEVSGNEGEAMLMVDLGLGEEIVEQEVKEDGLVEEEDGQPIGIADESAKGQTEHLLEVGDAESNKEIKAVSGNIENGEMRETASAFEAERSTSPPSTTEPTLKRKRSESPSSKLQPEAQFHYDITEGKPDQEMSYHDTPPAPSYHKRKRRTRGRGGRKRKSDVSELKYVLPKESSQPKVDEATKEPKAKKYHSARSARTSPGSAGAPTPDKEAKIPGELYLEDEKLEKDLGIIETAVATALDPEIPPEETVRLTDGSIVPAIQPDDAGVSLGKELRDGKVIETASPPRRMTRKRARETSVEPTAEPKAKATPKPKAKKVPSVKEPSVEPENIETEFNSKDDEPAAKRHRRGRSTSAEPSIPTEAKVTAKLKAKPRAKKTSSVKERSIKPDITMSENAEPEGAEPEKVEPSSVRPGSRRGRSASVEISVPVESKTPVKSKTKKTSSTPAKETSVESEAITVSRHDSTEFSADDTDRSGRGVRRSTRGKKSERENTPATPTNKRLRKQPIEPLSAIKEAEAEATVKKPTRASTRKKAA